MPRQKVCCPAPLTRIELLVENPTDRLGPPCLSLPGFSRSLINETSSVITSRCHGTGAKKQRVHVREMIIPILLRSMCNAHSVNNDGRDCNNNNEVEHMRPIEVQRNKFMAKISHKILFRFARVLQFFDWVRHCCCCRRVEIVCYGIAQTAITK